MYLELAIVRRYKTHWLESLEMYIFIYELKTGIGYQEITLSHWDSNQPKQQQVCFVSKMSAMGVPNEEIMRFGGWETEHVMKSVYRHGMQDKNKEAQRTVSNRLGDMLFH